MSSLKRHEGYLMVDQRACGLPAQLPGAAPTAKFAEVSTLTCSHCAGVAIKNPNRTRPRNFCRKCDGYICDGCGIVAAKPDYVHMPFAKLADLVRNGAVSIVGGSASQPLLVKTGVKHG